MSRATGARTHLEPRVSWGTNTLSHLTSSKFRPFSIYRLHSLEDLIAPQPFVLRCEVPTKEGKNGDGSEDDDSLHNTPSDRTKEVPSRMITDKIERLRSNRKVKRRDVDLVQA